MSVEHGMVPIRKKRYANPQRDWSRIKDRLPQHPVLEEFDHCISQSLWDTNTRIIYELAWRLGIKTVIVEDQPTTLTGTARLVEICQQQGATRYLAGASGSHYMDLSLFDQAGIAVEFQDPGNADPTPIIQCL